MYASYISFAYLHLPVKTGIQSAILHIRNTRYRWLAKPYLIRTFYYFISEVVEHHIRSTKLAWRINKTVHKKYDIPVISPKQAAENLINLANNHDFTLFEYFLTDRAGHKNNEEDLAEILYELSSFITELCNNLPPETLLMLCSDHGNCEDIKSKTHTLNPVPFVVTGLEKNVESNIKSIVDVYDFIIKIFHSKL